jgi:cytoskeletal protein CcmA (bactofilin family)
MLSVPTKTSKTTDERLEGGGRVDGRNGGRGKARSQAVSVLGEGILVTGDVSGEGDFRIQGRVEGSISTDGRLIVEASGEVLGDIEAAEVIASGKVSGRILSAGAVRLESGCQIDADIQAGTISIQEGGIVNGELKMGANTQTETQKQE